MSSRRSRSRQPNSTRIADDKVLELVAKLQALLPEARARGNDDRMSASRVLQETCTYIQNLHREVDGLSERLSELLATAEMTGAEEEIIRRLLMH